MAQKKTKRGKVPKKGSRKSTAKVQKKASSQVTEKEEYLENEYRILTEHLAMMRKRVRHFQQDNDFLEQEAKRVQEENKIFATYMAKRSQKMDDSIIRLSDYNRHMLKEIRSEKAELLAKFKEKENQLRSQLLEKQMQFSAMSKEVEELQPFKELQAEQNSRIKELELEVLSMWVMHADNVQQVKSKFMQDKAAYEKESRHKVQLLSRKSAMEAGYSLAKHTVKVRKENCRLRCEILRLIRQAQILKVHRFRLQEQNRILLEELEYDQDLVRILRIRRPPRGQRDIEKQGKERRLDLSKLWQFLLEERAKKAKGEGQVEPYRHYEILTSLLQSFITETSLDNISPHKSSSTAYDINMMPDQNDKKDCSASLALAANSSRSAL
ncbi:coiled-coil domain-containing protein 166 [Microcaecilia unicolor]|uniref:Coiled-coil domain-containing protein 166-like n=1 Tax=Microcaecilia unicolor TaxID=1415580 RepID=A0A6P7ZAE9_9AMPH|nr:coiled-coil domain-containing protein 166-like [Microcaecilia unicolor]XP_030076310.1 coiled-coil domain-containing protein 166-like [Microcaecilia unicolor]